MNNKLQWGRFELALNRPLIMGIVNVTDDSFSGDGLGVDAERAIAQGWRLKEEGAHILDIGGESSRPGARPVSVAEELARVLPVIEGLRDCGLPLSVDTVKPEVMAAVLGAGADAINDIAALRASGALEIVAASGAGVCLMHMQGTPGTMQAAPAYDDVVAEVAEFLAARAAACEAAGISKNRIVLDPGIGFGKSLDHNVALLRATGALVNLAYPLLAGVSRKSMIGALTGRGPEARIHGSVAAGMFAVARGASMLRVHDVAATRDALAVWSALKED